MVSSKATAVYDEHADWYNALMSPTGGGDYIRRVHATLGDLLGPGDGRTCLDVCCGTGAHASAVAGLGWTPVGVDLSRNQLRHAAHRLPVAVADATALPLADGSVPAAVCVLASTDVPDYPAVLREIARVLAPGGRFVHLGVHPASSAPSPTAGTRRGPSSTPATPTGPTPSPPGTPPASAPASAPGTSRCPTCSTGRRQRGCASSGRRRRGRTGCRICSGSSG
ncbi:2-methoxy-6-polyprenyl-1,4-benzoquinol methylase, mitochondrial [Streptomyces violarus]